MSHSTHHVLGTAGHIDHGKTALLRALTGVNTDRLPEEKARGITIDLGFAALNLGNHCLSIVDVPGHERFLRNMLAGATGFDFALLVVAADDSVMPQTREHLEILKLLGLTRGVVALTKTDLVTPDWLALVREDVKTLVAGSFLESAPVIATAATTGQGIDTLKQALTQICSNAPPKRESGLFRMAVDRSFTLAGHGTVVTGTVASGTAQVGDLLELWPGPRSVRVRSLHQHDRNVDAVSRGSRAAINLVGVHHTEVSRGQTLAHPGYLAPSLRLSVEIQPTADAPRPLTERKRYRIYLGTDEISGRLVFLGEEPREGEPAVLAQLVLREPALTIHGQPFVIREESPPATVGGGRVLHPVARRIRRKDAAAIARLRRLRSPDEDDALAAAIENLGLSDWSPAVLSRDSGLAVDQVPAAIDRLAARGQIVTLALGQRRSIRISGSLAASLEDRVLNTLKRLHAATPRLASIPTARLVTALADLDNDALVHSLLQRLLDRKQIAVDAGRVSIRGYEPKLSQSERKLKAEIAQAFAGTGFSPPDVDEWSKRPGLKASAVMELFTLLCDEEILGHLGAGLYVEASAVAELHDRVKTKLADGSTMSMAELRDLLGTTRKYAVPIGEYLDRIGLTTRDGDLRRLKISEPQTEAAR